jgi:IclR family acetate operon transcriptional repressor
MQGVRTIAELTGNSRSATQRILKSLADAGYAEQRSGGSYAVGPRLVELSARVFGAATLLKLANAVMTEVVREVGETCHLATYTEGDLFTTFVHRVETNHPIRHVQALGVRLPLHAGAVGKAILSQAPVSLHALALTRYTPRTITSKATLRAEMTKAKRQGFAISHEERVAGVVGVASPVLCGNKVVGGLTVAIPVSRMPPEGLEGIGKLVLARARELSAALGANGAGRG